MTKKKNNSADIEVKRVAAEKQQKARFLDRIKIIAKALIGEEKFALIPPRVLLAIADLHPPRLRVKAEPYSNISKTMVVKYNSLFAEFINEHTIETDFGDDIKFDWYYSEGLTLLNYLHVLSDHHFANAVEVKEALKEYLPGSDFHQKMGKILEIIVSDANVFLSEADKYLIQANIWDTAHSNMMTQCNTIYIDQYAPKKGEIDVDGHSRKIFKLGWILEEAEWTFCNIQPAQLGFKGKGADVSIPVVFQQHLIDRLQERIDLTPGLMQYAMFQTFLDPKIRYVKRASSSLVPYKLADQKLGYFVCKWCDNHILLSTFLFLTNDGTPEGKKLQKLLLLQKADKQYFKIDSMPHFNSYNFANNDQLSQIFKEAGCGSLLKIGHLTQYSQRKIQDKDPESIVKYLSDFALYKKGKNKISLSKS
jgi:hypothetical protein